MFKLHNLYFHCTETLSAMENWDANLDMQFTFHCSVTAHHLELGDDFLIQVLNQAHIYEQLFENMQL